MLTGWFLYALLSAFFASLVAIFGKIGLKNIDTNTATAIRSVIMAIFLTLVVTFQSKWVLVKEIVSQPIPMLFIILSGVSGALSWLFYFIALKNGKASQIVPIDRLSVIFALILAVIFLHENVSTKTMIGSLFIVVGAVLVALS